MLSEFSWNLISGMSYTSKKFRDIALFAALRDAIRLIEPASAFLSVPLLSCEQNVHDIEPMSTILLNPALVRMNNYAREGDLCKLQQEHAAGSPWDERTCASAARAGHIEILKWLHENGCPWDKWTCASAALGDHLETLKWLHENGCPWDRWTCENAVRRSDIETLKWARENGCPWDEWTRSQAAGLGYKEADHQYDS